MSGTNKWTKNLDKMVTSLTDDEKCVDHVMIDDKDKTYSMTGVGA